MQRQLDPAVERFIKDWVDYVNTNSHTKVGEWLFAFGAMAALSLKSLNLEEQEVKNAVQYMVQATVNVYNNTEDTFRKLTIQ